MQYHFSKKEMLLGVLFAIEKAGEKLKTFFPFDGTTDKNELSDAPIIN